MGQDVFAEVAVGITPDGVDVVDVALGVVVLDQHPGALHPVVVRLARFEPAGPGERRTSSSRSPAYFSASTSASSSGTRPTYTASTARSISCWAAVRAGAGTPFGGASWMVSLSASRNPGRASSSVGARRGSNRARQGVAGTAPDVAPAGAAGRRRTRFDRLPPTRRAGRPARSRRVLAGSRRATGPGPDRGPRRQPADAAGGDRAAATTPDSPRGSRACRSGPRRRTRCGGSRCGGRRSARTSVPESGSPKIRT